MGGLQIILNICSTLGFSGLLLFFVKRYYEKKDESLEQGKQERKEIKEIINKIARQNEEQYEMIASQNERIKSLSDDVRALREREDQSSQADRDLLRDAMLRTYHNCYEIKGWISVNDLESFQRMFESYTALHGNGMISSVREKIMSLPTVPPDSKN